MGICLGICFELLISFLLYRTCYQYAGIYSCINDVHPSCSHSFSLSTDSITSPAKYPNANYPQAEDAEVIQLLLFLKLIFDLGMLIF